MIKAPGFALDRRALLLTMPAFLLSACSSNLIGPPEASQLYVLNAAAAAAPVPGQKVAWALVVGVPSASASLDSERIALMHGSTTMDYFANALWSDRSPLLVQRALLEGFENSGRIAQVARSEDSLHADYSLESELRDFEARYEQADSAPTILVKIISKMVTARGHVIVATFNAEKSVPASANSVAAVVDAFDAALAAAVAQIVNWSLALPPGSVALPK